MTVSDLTVAAAADFAALTGSGTGYTSTLHATNGNHKFTLGGKLTTVASQPSGVYTGSYTVTVEYN